MSALACNSLFPYQMVALDDVDGVIAHDEECVPFLRVESTIELNGTRLAS